MTSMVKFSYKRHSYWTLQSNVYRRMARVITDQLEIDFQRIAAGHFDTNRRLHQSSHRAGDGAGGYACAAGERFPFHAALIGSHPKSIWTDLLNKICISTLRP